MLIKVFPLNNRIATILSVVFHPLILNTYLFALLFVLSPDLVGVSALEMAGLGSLLLLLFLNTFIAPSIVIFYMHKLGVISSMHVDDLAERRMPYLASVLIYALSTYLFGWKLQPISELAPQISILLGSATVCLLVVAIVSLFWKISAHAAGIGGSIGILAGFLMRFDEALLLMPLLLTIVLAGWLLSARLHLNAHTPAQILAGFMSGVLVSTGTVYFFF